LSIVNCQLIMDRRRFIKTGCAACLGLAGSAGFLESCAAGFPLVRARADGEVIRVAESEFRSAGDMLIVRIDTLESDILLRRKGEGYLALYLLCTHEAIGLVPTKGKIHCNAHGSVFDMDGKVLREPARRPLRKFRTETANSEIVIYLKSIQQ